MSQQVESEVKAEVSWETGEGGEVAVVEVQVMPEQEATPAEEGQFIYIWYVSIPCFYFSLFCPSHAHNQEQEKKSDPLKTVLIFLNLRL